MSTSKGSPRPAAVAEPPTDDDPWPNRIAWAISVLAAVYVFVHLEPSLMLADTTPAGGDLGAHAMGPSFLRGHLLDQGLLSGWSNMWWGGFPAFRFYMSLPTFVAVALDVILPVNVALKLAVALPLVSLPLVTRRLVRSFGMSPVAGALGSVASLVFLFDDSSLKHGGNIAATVVGEYAYTYGLVVGLAALASFQIRLTERREGGRERLGSGPALLFGAAAACHPIAACYVAVGMLLRAAFEPAPERVRAVKSAALTLVLGGAIAAYWYLPVAADRAFFNDLRNARDTGFGDLLFGMPLLVTLVVVLLALVGVVNAVRTRHVGVQAFAVLTGVMGLGVLIAPTGIIWNARLSPLWQFGLLLLAGLGVFAGIEYVRFPSRQEAAAAAGVLVVVMAGIAWDMGTLPFAERTTVAQGELSFVSSTKWLVGSPRKPNATGDIVTAGFGGYERGPAWASYTDLRHAIEEQVGEDDCARVMAEFDPSGRFGSTYAVPMLPYFSDDCVSSVMGFYTESSPNAPVALVAESALSPVYSNYEPGLPYEQVDLDRGVRYLRELGARFYVVYTPALRELARATDGLTSVAATDDWELFEVDGVSLVEPLTVTPVEGGESGGEDWQADALAWFQSGDPEEPRLAPDPPDEWGVSGTEVEATNVSVDDDGISFDVDRTGVPMLVRENYFPSWVADGAEGPFRVTPNWMVVVPTETTVRLHHRTQVVPWMGALLTLAGLITAGVLELRRRRAR